PCIKSTDGGNVTVSETPQGGHSQTSSPEVTPAISSSDSGSAAPKPAQAYDPTHRSLQLALAAAQVADELKGQDVLILDLRELTCIFDYFVIASGTSRRQLHAISEDIDHRLEDDLGDQRMGIEGYDASSWILLDYGTVVIHLFDSETRDYYGIEKLWGEAPQVPWRELISTNN
ncbi:MAG: ribosome silencing factor, partial [Planctomycetota bacterium]